MSGHNPEVIEHAWLVAKPDCDLKAIGMIVLRGGIDQTVHPIAGSLRGWSGEATDRCPPPHRRVVGRLAASH